MASPDSSLAWNRAARSVECAGLTSSLSGKIGLGNRAVGACVRFTCARKRLASAKSTRETDSSSDSGPRCAPRFDVLSRPSPRTPRQDAEAGIIGCYALRHRFHSGFEILVSRIDEQPLSQNLVRQQRREVGLEGSVMCVVRADQHAVPVPAAGLRWLNEQQHLTLEEVRGKPAKHSPCEKGRVLGKRLKDPLVLERLHEIDAVPVFALPGDGQHASRSSVRRPAKTESSPQTESGGTMWWLP